MAQFFRASKKATTSKTQTLQVSGCDHQGRGVARHEGKVWFIDGALQGETVKVEAYQNKSKFVEAKMVKVLEPSATRITPFCRDFETCGGCQLQHQSVDGQVSDKQQAVGALFKKFAGVDELPWQVSIIGQSLNYRRSARLACFFDKTSQSLKVGFREKGSKKIAEVAECQVLSRTFATHLTLLRRVLNTHVQLQSISHIQLSEADNGSYVLFRHLKPITTKVKNEVTQALAQCQPV